MKSTMKAIQKIQTKKPGEKITVKADDILGCPETKGTIIAVDHVNKWYVVKCHDDGEQVEVGFDGEVICGPF